MTYEYQLTAKEDIVKQALKHIGKLDTAIVKPIIGAKENLHYRNKAQFPVKHPQGSDRILADIIGKIRMNWSISSTAPCSPKQWTSVLERAKELSVKSTHSCLRGNVHKVVCCVT